MSTGRPWTPEELALLKRHYGSNRDELLSETLERTVDEVRGKAAELALHKNKGQYPGMAPMKRWTEDEERILRELHPTTPNVEIARILGRSRQAVVSKAHVLCLFKTDERLRAMGRANVALRRSRRPDREVG